MDYYQIMGLEKSASQAEIKRAYRKLARKYHPDVSKEADAESKFKELGEAYEVLKDSEKRKLYDSYGNNWQHQSASQGEQSTDYYHKSPQEEANFEDLFSELFRNKQHQSYHYDMGQDIHAKLTIELEDSYNGAEKSFALQAPSLDNNGQLHYVEKTISVKIPQNITDKQQIRLKGQGKKINAQQCGDLYIEIKIAPHKWFSLNGKNIELLVPITPWEAALGADITVPTLANKIKLKVPKGSQTDDKLRVKGKGLGGDLLVKLKIVIPLTVDENMAELYQKMAKMREFKPRANLGE